MKRTLFLTIFVIFFTILFTSLVGTEKSYGFDVDHLSSGMDKQTVLKILSPYYNFVSDMKDDNIVFRNKDKDITKGDYCQVIFSDNKLVFYSKNYLPSMKNYIIQFKQLNEKYGDNVRCSSTSKIDTDGEEESKSLECKWTQKNDEIIIFYHIFKSNDQLSITYRVK